MLINWRIAAGDRGPVATDTGELGGDTQNASMPPMFRRRRHQAPTSARPVSSEAFRLIQRLLAASAGSGQQMIQVIGTTRRDIADDISHAVASAAAALYGRTLLIEVRQNSPALSRLRATPDTGGTVDLQLFPLPTPDMVVAGLYHAGLHHEAGGTAAKICADLRALLGTDETLFHVVILDCPPLQAGTVALDLASLCNSCILTVRAGATCPPELRAAARDIGQAGGKVAGAVLFGAPSLLPAWLQRPQFA